MHVALAGGVGGARLAYGLSRALPADQLLVAVNTGDDFQHLGLAIAPDLDTVCYTLAELEETDRGWGRADETWKFMQTLAALGGPDWFQLGDADLALHALRTQLRASGEPLSAVTRRVCESMGIACRVLPMTDDAVSTVVHTASGPLAFQDYFVRRRCEPTVRGFEYRGAEQARPCADLLAALRSPALDAVVVCPSNPWLSIAPMLAMPELRSALSDTVAPVIAVSPIVGGQAVKGPAAKLMSELGLQVSALAVAKQYEGLVHGFVIDHVDMAQKPAIEDLGMRVLVTDAVMRGRQDRTRLANEILRKAWQ